MKNLALILIISGLLAVFGCKKDKESERFILLTTPIWTTESIVATGADTTGVGVIIKQLTGDAKFKEDGTGYFGQFTGQWRFNTDETEITIITASLPVPINADIILLTTQSLKLTIDVTLQSHPQDLVNLLLTFKAK